MSRQISFFHTEDDIAGFMKVIEDKGGFLYTNSTLRDPVDMASSVVQKMQSYFSRYLIVCNSCSNCVPCIDEGTAIEFINCTHSTDNPLEFQIGRLYLRRTDEGAYHKELEKLYTQLAKYLKKNYSYSKPCCAYFSPSFLYKSESGLAVGKEGGQTLLYFDRIVYPFRGQP